MSEDIFRKQVREIIKKHISENKDKELTQEGIIDGVFNHIKSVLQKGSDKRFNAKLQQIAKSGPEGKKAVSKFIKSQDDIADAAKDVDDILSKIGFEF